MQLWEHRAASALFERWYQHDAHVKAYLWHLHMLNIGLCDYLDDIEDRRRALRNAEPTNDHVHEPRPFADNE